MATGTWMDNMFSKMKDIFGGVPERLQQVPRFTEPQQEIFSQLQQGVGGALPDVFQQLLSMLTQDPEAAKQFEAPAMRQFHEEIVPTIAQRFTSKFGTGSKSSSGFRQALGAAGAGLEEKLSKQRGERSGQAINQLIQMIQAGLLPQFDTLLRQRQPGLIETGVKGAITAAPSFLAGGI